MAYFRSWANVGALFFISACIFAGLVVEARYSEIPFKADLWKSAPSQQWRMANNLVRSGILHGKSEDEVLTILGKQAADSYDGTGQAVGMLYHVGSSGVDDLWLEIVISNGFVVQVKIRPD